MSDATKTISAKTAALGMNECEAAMWPHWPVHASLMYISFWFYYTLDRCIAVFGHDAEDPFKPGFQAPNGRVIKILLAKLRR